MSNEAEQKLANVSVCGLLITEAPELLQNALCFQSLRSPLILVLREEGLSDPILPLILVLKDGVDPQKLCV